VLTRLHARLLSAARPVTLDHTGALTRHPPTPRQPLNASAALRILRRSTGQSWRRCVSTNPGPDAEQHDTDYVLVEWFPSRTSSRSARPPRGRIRSPRRTLKAAEELVTEADGFISHLVEGRRVRCAGYRPDRRHFRYRTAADRPPYPRRRQGSAPDEADVTARPRACAPGSSSHPPRPPTLRARIMVVAPADVVRRSPALRAPPLSRVSMP